MSETMPSLPRIAPEASNEWQEHPRFRGIYVKKLLTPADNALANVNVVRVPPGCTIGCHQHPTQVETIYVLAGQSTLTLGEVEVSFYAGHIVAVPMGMEHFLHNPGTETVELLTIFTPPLT
jgi:quercetin dioxygenase-like cupin family protein